MFSQRYENTELGEILITLELGDEDVELSFWCEPPDLGVSKLKVRLKNDDAGWIAGQAALDAMTEENAVRIIKEANRNSGNLLFGDLDGET